MAPAGLFMGGLAPQLWVGLTGFAHAIAPKVNSEGYQKGEVGLANASNIAQ